MNKGFTLIELLVVITIIGLLATFAVISLGSLQAKARDSKRISDLEQISIALEMYYLKNSFYPQIDRVSSNQNGWQANLGTVLAPYLKLPLDPTNNGNFNYSYDADSGNNYQNYGLMARMESSDYKNMVAGDGGFYNNANNGRAYERGAQPVYCMNKYAGNRRDWWSSNSVCQGGN